MAADENMSPAHRFNELPPETQEFLSQLEKEDIKTLKDGLRLVMAMQTVGTFMKWLIVCVVGMFIGAVMLYENAMKVYLWFGGPK
ncbi:hypothetical protein P8H26_14860 [Pseudochrobactrum sp. sp1633]|uniref:hypothetical protein n=1 Tax=Pseudochrobactrum sp. sp1633 TaxID=3036706 RepID=UPI0025A4E17A|nr:hypothetical protein [Pseudochrobactrum sp. sp1633]MDM8346671.1 hypothetical protein [Pseudochrobactrum sp. sp1633]